MRCITRLSGRRLKQLRSHKILKVLRTVFILFTFQLFVMSVAAQPATITGTITDADGETIIGANIMIKGTTIGTISDVNGQFTLDVDDPSVTLVISFVGYSTQEVVPGEQQVLSITLAEDMVGLDEVVVVGYGTQKKVNLTGAVGTASGEVLEDRPIVNAGEGLQGIIPNFNITIRNGDPADTRTNFNVRGYESINGGDPLILIDGVPGNLNRLNPNDIASVTVLKDAAAGAIYGARAAFGVVLVETKKGKGRKPNVSLSAEFGMAKPIMFIDPITDPYQYALARNVASQRSNGTDAYNEERLAAFQKWSNDPTFENAWTIEEGILRFNGYNDYQNMLLTDFAPQQKYDFNVSGATESASYYVSFGYLNKDGYLKNKDKNENFKRYNVMLKGDFKVNKWLSVDSRALISTELSDKPHFYNWDVNINTTARVKPDTPIQFPDLPYYLTPGDHDNYLPLIGKYFGSVNFLEYLTNGGRETFTKTNVTLTQGVTLTPFKGFSIRGDFSYSLYNRAFQDVASKVEVINSTAPDLALAPADLVNNGFSGNDWINNISDNNQYFVFNTYADYTIDQGSHYFKAMVGFNQEWGNNQMVRAQAYSLITPQVPDLNATVGAQETYGSKSDVALRGVFYRVNYIFKDRYLVEANGRYDGTSRFPKDDRFGFFPSFSVGWRLSEEAFMSGTSGWLDNLKVRGSYGTLGNQLLGSNYYPYIPTMGIGTSPIMLSAGQRSPYVSAAGLVSPTLTWETVVNKNLGLDFTMLGNRLDFSFDIYRRDTKDMLTDVTYPDILGTDAPEANAADLKTTGWEVAATWKNRINTNWNYGVTLALSDNRSEITKYDNPTNSINEYYVGYVIGERWGYETEGIFQTEGEVDAHADQSQVGSNWRPGDMKYADLNGDGEITAGSQTLDDPGDRKIIAYESPRFSYGLNGNLGWKNFSLNLFFQGVMKYDYWPPNGNWVAFYPYNAGHVENYYLTDTWSPENPNAYFAAPHFSTDTKKNIVPQSRYVQNGAYIRLKTMTLTYNLPSEWAGKVGMQAMRVYFSGLNMFEYTSMRKPLDPEVRPTLTQEYYKQRIYSIGLNVTF